MISSAYRALLAESSTLRQQDKQKEMVGAVENQQATNKSLAVMQYERISSVVSSSQFSISEAQQRQHQNVQTHQMLLPHSGREPNHQNQHLNKQQQLDSKVHQMQQSKVRHRQHHNEEKMAQFKQTPHHQHHHTEGRQDHHNKDLRQQQPHNQNSSPHHRKQHQQPAAENLTLLEGATAKQKRQNSSPHHRQQHQQPAAENLTLLEGATAKQKRNRKRKEQHHEKDVDEQRLDMQTQRPYYPQQLQQLQQQQFGRTLQQQHRTELSVDHSRQQQQQTKALKTENRRQKQQSTENRSVEQQQTQILKTENRRQKQQSTENRSAEQQQTKALKAENMRQNTENRIEQQKQHQQQKGRANRQQKQQKTLVQTEKRRQHQSTHDQHTESINTASPQSCTDSSRFFRHPHHSAQMNAQAESVAVNEHQWSTEQVEIITGKKRKKRKKQIQKEADFHFFQNATGSLMMESDDLSLASALDNVSLNFSDVFLDDYNSDLNAQIGPNGWDMATRNTPSSFHLLWAGSKANFGVQKGKVFFEAKVIKNLPSECNSSSDEPNAARIGWSDESSLLALGEEPISFGYETSRKFYVNNIHRNYGQNFNVNDVIGALLDLDSRPATISFMKNGTFLGIAESFSLNSFGKDRQVVMYPHIFLKNCRVAINFGQHKGWFPPPQGFQYIGHLPTADKVASLESPKSYTLCQVIMIIGLPGAGKTTWAKRQQKENPEKRYNILGTDLLIERMGFPNLLTYRDRFDQLYRSAEECFKALLKMAATKRRNYILDQTNVFDSARKRKMAKFSEFYRIAAVIQPNDQELERRSRERAEKQQVPDWVVRDMKTNYSLPAMESTFHKVIFIELDRDNTQSLVTQYNRCRQRKT